MAKGNTVVTPQKRFPNSARDKVRQYMLSRQPGRKVTLEQIAKATGLNEGSVRKRMAELVHRGEPFLIVQRAKAWKLDPQAVSGQEQLPLLTTKDAGLVDRLADRLGAPEARPKRYLKPSNGLPEVNPVSMTPKGSLILQDSDGVVWIARVVEE